MWVCAFTANWHLNEIRCSSGFQFQAQRFASVVCLAVFASICFLLLTFASATQCVCVCLYVRMLPVMTKDFVGADEYCLPLQCDTFRLGNLEEPHFL